MTPSAEAPAPRDRFPVGLTIAVGVAFLILIGLGTWQLQRLAWKQDLLARIAALQAAPARPLSAVLDGLSTGGEGDFIRVTADCPGLPRAPVVELYTVRDGQAGVRLISACRTGDPRHPAILVDRGFVGDTVSARPPADAADRTPFRVTGVLRKPAPGNTFTPPDTARLWYTRNLPAMAKALGAPTPAPLMLMAETPTNPEWPALIPAPIPIDIPNRHLEYALTWYGLAAALLGVYAAVLFKRRMS